MNVGKVQTVLGYTIVELPDMPYRWFKKHEYDNVIFCGDFNQMLWVFHQIANRLAAEQHLDTLLVEMAARVGVEYTPTQRRNAVVTDERNRT